MWSDAPRTPRYVWSISTITATVLHMGSLWWIRTYWQSSREVISPAAIAVIAIPESEVGAIAAPPPLNNPPLTDPAAAQIATPETLPEPPPINNSTSDPPPQTPTSPQQPTSGTVESPSSDRFTPTPTTSPPVETAPISPQTEPSSPPSPPVPTPTSSPRQPSSPPPAPPPPLSTPPPTAPSGDPSASPSPAATPDPEQRFIPALRLEPLPSEYWADPPDVFPQEPSGWRQSVLDLVEQSNCYPSLPPAADQAINLQLTVEENGDISTIQFWGGNNESIGKDLANCLNTDTLKANLPPLIPAMVSGAPIPTDLMLLTLELSISE